MRYILVLVMCHPLHACGAACWSEPNTREEPKTVSSTAKKLNFHVMVCNRLEPGLSPSDQSDQDHACPALDSDDWRTSRILLRNTSSASPSCGAVGIRDRWAHKPGPGSPPRPPGLPSALPSKLTCKLLFIVPIGQNQSDLRKIKLLFIIISFSVI